MKRTKTMKWAPDGGHNDVVYVYLLTNDIPNAKGKKKKYVGICWNPPNRWHEHFEYDSAIGAALRKYGFENFTKEVIAVSNRKGALELEAHYCEIYDCLSPNGYNLNAGGIGVSYTAEQTRLKLRRNASERTGTKNHRYGKKGKDHNRYGVPHTRETRDKMSISQSGEGNGFYGHKHSLETRTAISNKKRGTNLKLTSNQVCDIEGRIREGECLRIISRDYNVSSETVRRIKIGKYYRGRYES